MRESKKDGWACDTVGAPVWNLDNSFIQEGKQDETETARGT
jgi:hypothetical protein